MCAVKAGIAIGVTGHPGMCPRGRSVIAALALAEDHDAPAPGDTTRDEAGRSRPGGPPGLRFKHYLYQNHARILHPGPVEQHVTRQSGYPTAGRRKQGFSEEARADGPGPSW